MNDIEAIRRTVELCFHGLDTRSRALFGAQFTDDASAQYHAGTGSEANLSSKDDVVEYNISRMESYVATTHLMANFDAQVDGDEAHSVTNAVANVVVGDRVLVRGLRYHDTLRRVGGAWKITRRVHGPSWQYNAEHTAPTVTHPR